MVCSFFYAGCKSRPGGGGANHGENPPAGDRKVETVSGVDFALRYVPGGSFKLNTNETVPSNRLIDITITKGYWMAETEVTQELWAAVMAGSDNNTAPSYFNNSPGREPAPGEIQSNRAVDRVTWYDATEFCNRLSGLTGRAPVYTLEAVTRDTDGSISIAGATADFSKNGYRLPTEMEWMWAAMGARDSTNGYKKEFAGDTAPENTEGSIGDYAWYTGNSSARTHEVGKKAANELGLRDMTGNVWEWCWDKHGAYPEKAKTDYQGDAAGSNRVIRGGSWYDSMGYCVIASRNGIPSFQNNVLGLRVVRAAD